MTTPFFRIRWIVRLRASAVLHTRQNAILYALFCDAARGGNADGPMHMPEGLLLDAPEVGRDTVEAGECFAFGATLIEADAAQATRKLHHISEGLSRAGAKVPKKPVALGGNFDLIEVYDLVAGKALSPGQSVQPLTLAAISEEFSRLTATFGTPITLRFDSPLRLERPESEIGDGHRYADETHLNIGQLLRTVQKRLTAVGIRRAEADADPVFGDSAIELLENRLTWLDLEYGRWNNRKSLGGALGRIRVTLHDPGALAALVWGQYARFGKNLHFGFGHYRIEELGPDPTACPRAAPLDDRIGLAIERQFETSGFTHRKGYTRDTSPARWNQLLHEGWQISRQLDISEFVDRIPLRLIRDRLAAWLGEDEAACAATPRYAALVTMDLLTDWIELEGGRVARRGDLFLVLRRSVPLSSLNATAGA